ncbi:MAG: hypothetical protein HS115_13315 [Spirochaetales bacterium]|nr:hypothetical protein [Spirochaetales bacterium]
MKHIAFLSFFLLTFLGLDRLAGSLVPEQYSDFPDYLRYHSLSFSERMNRYARPAILIVGDSRTQNGVVAEELGPSAFNLATGSSGIAFVSRLLETPGIVHKELRGLLWGISPRIFNEAWQDPVAATYARSPALAFREQEAILSDGPLLNQAAALPHVAFEELFAFVSQGFAYRTLLRSTVLDRLDQGRRFRLEEKEIVSAGGFSPTPERQRRSFNREEQKNYLASHRSGAFYFSQERFQEFQNTINKLREKQIQIYLFIPPMHPLLARSGVADHDGTPRSDYKELLSRLERMKQPGIVVRDFHQAGRNPYRDWTNYDHLSEAGARKLTAEIRKDLSESTELLHRKRAAGVVRQIVSFLTGSLSAQTEDRSAPILRFNRSQKYTIVDMLAEPVLVFRVDYQDSGSGLNLSSARFFLNDRDRTADIQVTPTHMIFKPSEELQTGLYRARFEISDKAGNKAVVIWDVMYQEC